MSFVMLSLYDRQNVNDMWAVSILKTLYFKNIVFMYFKINKCVCVPVSIFYSGILFWSCSLEMICLKSNATDVPIKVFDFLFHGYKVTITVLLGNVTIILSLHLYDCFDDNGILIIKTIFYCLLLFERIVKVSFSWNFCTRKH